jgi:glutaredoxin-like protein NrdH
MTVTIFTAPGCTACRDAKSFLTTHGIAFTERNVADEPEALNELVRLGCQAIPVIQAAGETQVGFNRRRLAALLRLE